MQPHLSGMVLRWGHAVQVAAERNPLGEIEGCRENERRDIHDIVGNFGRHDFNEHIPSHGSVEAGGGECA